MYTWVVTSTPTAPLLLRSEFSELTLTLDPRSGLPMMLGTAGSPEIRVDLATRLRLVTGGTEEIHPLGGLAYRDCVDLTDLERTSEAIGTLDHDGRSFVVGALAGEWRVCLRYRFTSHHPRLMMSIEVHPPSSGDRILRNLHLDTTVLLADTEGWTIQSPGNRLRPDLALSNLTEAVAVSPVSGLLGSSGLVSLEHAATSQTFVWWPFSRGEIGDQSVLPGADGPELRWQTDLAGEPEPDGVLTSGALFLDVVATPWRDVEADAQQWLAGAGVRLPAGAPAWVERARIFEVQIGYSVFAGDWKYAPYPQATDLLNDLDRIAGLGFTTLQIMPRHPFPSYNVMDYDDVSTSWGDEEVLREVVRRCHQRGMRVIFDILLHGVVDQEAVTRAADAVRNGPYFDRLAEDTPPLWADDGDSYHVAYSRHIIDFEAHWKAGSPLRHPLADAHPEWFCRDSSGQIVGVYTKAFDNAHPGWQQYFIDAAVELVRRLDIDGYRFDAPTYNYFLNWSDRTRTHAGVSMLGCVELFVDLRRALKDIKADVMLYTEPSGLLLRESMDVNYNYDEQWLFGVALSQTTATTGQDVRHARDLARWLEQRDAWLPTGAITAHHIDSHDTFWWPLPGRKWFRELVGIDPTRAMTATFALSGGSFMMFVGGEVGLETDLPRIAELRDDYPELATGYSAYSDVQVSADCVYAVVRRGSTGHCLVLVNLSHEPAPTTVSVALPGQPPNGSLSIDNLWTPDAPLTLRVSEGQGACGITLEPFQIRVLDLSGRTEN